MKLHTPEILINASQVSHNAYGGTYEFVLNEHLCITECVRVESLSQGIVYQIQNVESSLKDMLFEFNHVRVNPRVDNALIISNLTSALFQIGVEVKNMPASNSMAVCFKPLGEISDNVRFYILGSESRLIFLSRALKPYLVVSNKP